MASPEPAPFPSADADLCVKCGLCLPHCPSYLDTRHEADSPRGRIALMQALADGRIAMTARVEQHLDGCLGCRACERVCPAQVPYGALIDAGRGLMATRRPARLWPTRLLSRVLRSRRARRAITTLLRALQSLGLQRLLDLVATRSRGVRLARLASLLPRLEPPAAVPWPTVQAPSARVAVFAGCVGDIVERTVVSDLARLLAACGIETVEPAAQTCCGALDQHAGRAGIATRLARRNLKAFASADTVLPLATGCAATLLDYARLAEGGAAFVAKLRDPVDYLSEHAERLKFRALPMRVAIHESCTQANVIRRGDALRRLLARIPELELVELDPASRCCGAAGSYFVTEPDSADRLLQPKLDAAQGLAPALIVSANVGCSLHLAAGLRRAGLRVPVLHPLSLLSRQLA